MAKHKNKTSSKKKSTSHSSITNNKPWLYIGLLLVVIAVLILIFSRGGKDYSTLAQCLADEGYVMGGTSWCGHCADQKAMFKGAFEEVIIPNGAYKDCDVNQNWCTEQGIRGYPTWITPQGDTLEGVQSLSTLAKVSGCSIE